MYLLGMWFSWEIIAEWQIMSVWKAHNEAESLKTNYFFPPFFSPCLNKDFNNLALKWMNTAQLYPEYFKCFEELSIFTKFL